MIVVDPIPIWGGGTDNENFDIVRRPTFCGFHGAIRIDFAHKKRSNARGIGAHPVCRREIRPHGNALAREVCASPISRCLRRSRVQPGQLNKVRRTARFIIWRRGSAMECDCQTVFNRPEVCSRPPKRAGLRCPELGVQTASKLSRTELSSGRLARAENASGRVDDRTKLLRDH